MSVEDSPDLSVKCRSGSVPNVASHHLLQLQCHHDLCSDSLASHHDLQHDDEEDEEERQCLKHLDHLGLALENTFKDVESIDAFVGRLCQGFQQEAMTEQRFMSCLCSARMARAACCRTQIDLWRQLQHDIQEFCCHHQHHEEDIHQPSDDCSPLHRHLLSSDCSLCSQEAGDVDLAVSRLNKMVLFDLVKRRLDPLADSKAFVQHWILKGLQGDDSPHHEVTSP